MWLCFHDKIPIKKFLLSRGMTILNQWVMCSQAKESIDHIFKVYSKVRALWSLVSILICIRNLFQEDFNVWLRGNFFCEDLYSDSFVTWNCFFFLTFWNIWLCRNDYAFNVIKNIDIDKAIDLKSMEYWIILWKDKDTFNV